MFRTAFAALLAAAFLVAPLVARAADPTADFSEHCKKAAAKELSLKKKDIKIIGKHKGGEGYTMVSFNVSDGRRGTCRCENNGRVYDIQMDASKPATRAPKSQTKTKKK